MLNIGQSCTRCNQIGDDVVIGKLVVYYTDEDFYEAGDSGYEMVVRNDFATPSMVQDMYDKLKGCIYRPFEAEGAYIDPASELGDEVEVCGIESVAYTMNISPSNSYTADVSAPGESDIDHEYPFEGQYSKEIKQRVKLDAPYYGVSIGRKNGLEIKRSDGASEAVFNSDVFAMRAKNESGQMQDAIYFDVPERKYRISGNVIIDGSLSSDANFTDSLYAEQGDVSQLTVDQLSTSKRIVKYLSEDTSDDNYIEIQDKNINFVTAKVVMETNKPQTEELYNRYGEQIYWSKDISEAEIIDGYPFIDGEQIYTTKEATEYPVIVYKYVKLLKRSTTFEMDSETGNYNPVDIFGIGTGTGDNGKGRIEKTTTSFDISYQTQNGKLAEINMADDGFVDATNRRASVRVDTGAKTITISPEGALARTETINYVESENKLTLTYSDGQSFDVEVV